MCLKVWQEEKSCDCQWEDLRRKTSRRNRIIQRFTEHEKDLKEYNNKKLEQQQQVNSQQWRSTTNDESSSDGGEVEEEEEEDVFWVSFVLFSKLKLFL